MLIGNRSNGKRPDFIILSDDLSTANRYVFLDVKNYNTMYGDYICIKNGDIDRYVALEDAFNSPMFIAFLYKNRFFFIIRAKTITSLTFGDRVPGAYTIPLVENSVNHNNSLHPDKVVPDAVAVFDRISGYNMGVNAYSNIRTFLDCVL